MINAINFNNLYVAMSNNSMYCDFFFFLGVKGSVKVSDSVHISREKNLKFKTTSVLVVAGQCQLLTLLRARGAKFHQGRCLPGT